MAQQEPFNALLDLGRNTVIKVKHLSEVVDTPNGDGKMVVDFVFSSRGRLSRLAIKKSLRRFINNALLIEIAAHPSKDEFTDRAARARRWSAKHVAVMPTEGFSQA
jgi:hypothetical protein